MFRMNNSLKESIKDGVFKDNVFWKLDVMF